MNTEYKPLDRPDPLVTFTEDNFIGHIFVWIFFFLFHIRIFYIQPSLLSIWFSLFLSNLTLFFCNGIFRSNRKTKIRNENENGNQVIHWIHHRSYFLVELPIQTRLGNASKFFFFQQTHIYSLQFHSPTHWYIKMKYVTNK